MFLKKHIFLWLGCFFMLNLAGSGKNITEKDIQENPLFERLSSFRQRNDYFQFLQLREKQPDDAYIFCQSLLSDIDSTLIVAELGEVYEFVAHRKEYTEFQFNDAIRYQEKALHIYETLEQEQARGHCLIALARLNTHLGNYHTAFNNVHSGMEIAEKYKEKYQIRECYLLMEKIHYFYNKDIHQAKAYNRLLTGPVHNRDEAYQKARALNSQLSYPMDLAQMDSVLTACEQLCLEYHIPSVALNAFLNGCLNCITLGNLSASKQYLTRAKPWISTFKDSGFYYATSGYYHSYSGDTLQAIQNLKQSIRILSRGDFDPDNMYAYFWLQHLYNGIGKTQEAYEALLKYNEIYTSLNNNNIVLNLSKSLNQLERKQADQEIQAAKQYNRLFLIGVVLLLGVGAFVFYLILHNQRLKNEHYRLEQENIAIDIKRKEEIILMKQLEQHQHQLFIDELIRRLAETNQKALSAEVKKELFQVIRQLNDKVTNNDWNEVEKTMNVNHLTFFENLVKAYPNLTPNERRLCTLMHLNMSTKEISNITHQSINSINTARTRLRKKFNLSGDDTSLVAFLDQFDTKKETNF